MKQKVTPTRTEWFWLIGSAMVLVLLASFIPSSPTKWFVETLGLVLLLLAFRWKRTRDRKKQIEANNKSQNAQSLSQLNKHNG